MAYELTGTIKKIFDRQDFPSGFYKQEFVVTTDERYPQDVKLDCLKEKVDLLGPLKEGDRVKVSFDVRGREWNEKFFVDLTAWKIEQDSGESSGASEHVAEDRPAAAPSKSSKPLPPEDPGKDEFMEEDIPF
jgi:hypothetical protein